MDRYTVTNGLLNILTYIFRRT